MDDLSAYYSHYNLPSIVPPPPTGVASIAIIPTHSVYLPAQASTGAREEVRTLFVAGLPEDVKPREIYNLFREFPGYETSHLRNSDEAKVQKHLSKEDHPKNRNFYSQQLTREFKESKQRFRKKMLKKERLMTKKESSSSSQLTNAKRSSMSVNEAARTSVAND